MGFNAHHCVEEFASMMKDKKRKKQVKALEIKGCATAYMTNEFYLCSAYDLEDEVKGPWDLIQEKAANSCEGSENGRDFTWDDSDIDDLIGEICNQFPKHEESKAAIEELKEIQKRSDHEGSYDFHCF